MTYGLSTIAHPSPICDDTEIAVSLGWRLAMLSCELRELFHIGYVTNRYRLDDCWLQSQMQTQDGSSTRDPNARVGEFGAIPPRTAAQEHSEVNHVEVM